MKSLAVLVLLCCPILLFAAPHVVVSIAPIHALATAIMQGQGEPQLLLPPTYSPHTYQLKPSAAALLSKAELIVWVGPELEHALGKSIEKLSKRAKILQLSRTKDLTLLPFSNAAHGTIDPHVWLDPQNAIRIAAAIKDALIEADPAATKLYQHNYALLSEKLSQLDHELEETLQPVQGIPFLVYHDALQYFNHRYHLNQVGVINTNPDLPLKARNLYEIHKMVFVKKPVCLFGENQVDSNTLAQIAEDLRLRFARIDILGSTLDPGAALYTKLMKNLAHTIKQCLAT
jgi:zinc transport system substrate-binding protein